MKAAVYYGLEDIRVERKHIRPLSDKEVLIRVRSCGVCGTDIHLYHGSPAAVELSPPIVFGHEFSGEVAEIGRRVTSVSPGDRVTIDPNVPCGECDFCRKGHRHLCRNLQGVGSNIDGGFAEYSVIPESVVYRLPRDLSFDHSALSEPLACCLHGIDRAGIRPGHKVAVIGAGAIGLLMLQLSFLQGADHVFVSEPNPRRRLLAEQLGATAVDPTEHDFLEALHSHLPDGVDVAIECAGVEEALRETLGSVMRGGTALLFSVPEPHVELSIRPYDMFYRELTIRGSFTNPLTHARAVDLISSGRVRIDPLITHRYPLEKIHEAFQTQGGPEAIKVLVNP